MRADEPARLGQVGNIEAVVRPASAAEVPVGHQLIAGYVDRHRVRHRAEVTARVDLRRLEAVLADQQGDGDREGVAGARPTGDRCGGVLGRDFVYDDVIPLSRQLPVTVTVGIVEVVGDTGDTMVGVPLGGWALAGTSLATSDSPSRATATPRAEARDLHEPLRPDGLCATLPSTPGPRRCRPDPTNPGRW